MALAARTKRHSKKTPVLHVRRSKNPSKQPRVVFFVAPMVFMVVIGMAIALALPFRSSAQVTPVPTPVFIVKDIPRKVEDIIKHNRSVILDKLRVAGDVAYKTGLRIFYQQLAQLTFQFVSNGLNGEPLFQTSPTHFTDVYLAAQNDYLDKLSQQFGVTFAATDTETEKSIALLSRIVLTPTTACEQQCSTASTIDQVEVKALESDKKKFEENAKVDKITEVTCPFTYDQPTDTYRYNPVQTTPLVNPVTCAQILNNLLITTKQKAQKALNQCVQACNAGRTNTLRNNTEFNRQVGNEKAAIALSELFQPQQNDLGVLLAVVQGAREKGVAVEAAERDVAQYTNIQSTRTLSGEVKAPGSLNQQYANIGINQSTGDVNTVTGSSIANAIKTAAGDALVAKIGRLLLSNCTLNKKACKPPTGTSKAARLIFGNSGNLAAAEATPIQFGRPDIISGDPSRNPISAAEDLQSKGIIDQRFGQAITQSMTVKQALEGGFLDRDRTFGFTKNGEQPADGYSYRSILYLRQARVVPVGWELAAKYVQLYDKRDIGLGELVSKYNICGQDSEHDDNPGGAKTCHPVGSGVPQATIGNTCVSDDDCGSVVGSCTHDPEASPYCGLVDPNWVLKAPLTYCRKQGAGEQVLVKNFICDEDTNGNGRVDCSPVATNPLGGDVGRYDIQRQPDVCVDEPTCIAENEDGSCRSYGYCFEDRDTFRLNGTLCPNYYSSCTTYTNTDGEQASYLSKTVETNGCSVDNAGCQAFCADKRDSNGQYLCSANGSAVTCPAGETCTCRTIGGETCTVGGNQQTCVTGSGATCTLGTNIAYFDRDAQTCDAGDAGCHQYISATPSTNLLANSGFEIHQPQAGCGSEVVKGWGCQQVSTDTSGIGDQNQTSIVIPSGGSEVAFTNERIPAGLDTGRPLARASFTLSYYAKTDGGSCSGAFGLRANDATVDLDPVVGGTQATVTANANYTTTWQRITNTFFIPDGAYDNVATKHIIQPFVRSSTCNILIDNIELENGPTVTPYANYGSSNVVHLNKTRQVCSRVDVSCQQYTPIDGGDQVTGVVNWPDICSAEDAGCRAYRKEATDHVPFRAAVDPINLTASSGKTCTAAEVGCEEYTNLDIQAQGGEGKEYYTQIQQCVKPVDNNSTQQTYFTWVGSDQSGYQLKSFRLKASNLNNVNGETGTAPCTNLQVGTNAGDNNPDCEDTLTIGAPNRVAFCSPSDIGRNPDCTEYFDGNGNVFHRLRSRTVPVSDECHPYRNSLDQQAGTDAVYHILGAQSSSCRAEAAQCRAFTGNAGNNTLTTFTDSFEGASSVSTNWQALPGGSVALSAESVTAGGRSMDASGQISTRATTLDQKLRKGATYTLSFWAKPNGATKVRQAFIQVGTQTFSLVGGSRPEQAIASEWHPYTVGPVTVEADTNGQTVQLALEIVNAAGNAAHAFFDNIALTEITDRVYLIDNSYHTCPDSALGCTAYRNTNNSTVYFKSVTRLCGKEAVGCTAMIDTQNSSDPFASTPIRGVSVPADTTVAYVDSQSSRCSAEAKGCTAFGSPVYDVNKKISSFQSTALKDDPDTHAQILCSVNELYCSEYTTNDGTKAYFKDPRTQTCEYKKLSGDTEFRWYVSGTGYLCPVNTPPAEGVPTGLACTKACNGGLRNGLSCVQDADCPASNGTCVNSFCQGGANAGQACSTTSDCSGPAGTCVGNTANVGKACSMATAGVDCTAGNICSSWTGICPAEQDGCNEYRDPSDPAQCRSTCPLQLSSTSGKPIPFDESCQPTICLSGAKTGSYCASNADCPGRCIGGTSPDRFCLVSSDCSGGGSCSNVGTCSGEGIPGCRSYTYLKQTIGASLTDCNGRVDIENGCRPFNDTSNPVLNFRSF